MCMSQIVSSRIRRLNQYDEMTDSKQTDSAIKNTIRIVTGKDSLTSFVFPCIVLSRIPSPNVYDASCCSRVSDGTTLVVGFFWF